MIVKSRLVFEPVLYLSQIQSCDILKVRPPGLTQINKFCVYLKPKV